MSESKTSRLDQFDSLDDFLREEGVYDEVQAQATKRVIALKLQVAMRERKLTKTAMAALMQTSRAQLDRVLDPADAAKVVGRELRIDLA